MIRSFVTTAVLTCTALAATACKPASDEEAKRNENIEITKWPLSTKSKEARLHIEAGDQFSFVLNPDRAYDEFKRAVAADTSFGYAYLRVWEMALDPTERGLYLQKAIERVGTANETERLIIGMAKAEFVDNDYPTSITLAKQLTLLHPTNARAWALLGGRQLRNAEIEEGRASLEKSIALAPDEAGARLTLAESFYMREPKDLGRAETLIQASIKLWPTKHDPYVVLGALRRAQGRYDDALTAYSRAYEVDSTRSAGIRSSAFLLTLLSRYDSARGSFDAAIRTSSPDDKIDLMRYRAYIAMYEGDATRSLEELVELENAIVGMPTRTPARQQIATRETIFAIAVHHNRLEDAARALARRTAAFHELPDSIQKSGPSLLVAASLLYDEVLLAAFKREFKLADQKLAEFEKLVSPNSNAATMRDVHDLRGQIALLRGQYARAESELRQAGAAGYVVSFNLALALEQLGRVDEALPILRRIVDQRTGFNLTSAIVRFDAEQKLRALSSADTIAKQSVKR